MRKSCSAALVALLAAIVGVGQTAAGNITGAVRDTTGNVIAGAVVKVTSLATGQVRQVTTNDRGEFTVPLLPIGEYTVAAEREAFKRAVISNVALRVDQTAALELVLEPGQLTDTVEISSTAALLESQTSSLGQVIENKNIVNLPLNGRNPFALGQLSGHAVAVTGVVTNIPFVAGGARYTANDFLLDGVDNNTFLHNYAYTPSVDAVGEFKVQTNSFAAEFGRASGSVVNATIRGGTNELHGSLFEFLRNEKLDANNFFTNATPLSAAQLQQGLTEQPRQPFKQNQFGGTLGGPVVLPEAVFGPLGYDGANRTFFFFDYQGMRQRTSASSFQVDVPIAAVKRGDFSTYNVPIFDPLTRRVGPGGKVIADAFPGNIIPLNRIDPAIAELVKLIPDPNAGASGIIGKYVAFRPRGLDQDQFDVRIDQKLGADSLMGRYSFSKSKTENPGAFPGILSSGGANQNRTHAGVLTYLHIFSPAVVNEFRFGTTRLNGGNVGAGTNQIIPGVAQFPFPVQGVASFNFNFSGQRSGPAQYAALGGSGIDVSIENRFQWSDNLTVTRGSHTIKIGGDIRRYRFDRIGGDTVFGAFTFGSTYTAIADVPNSGAPFADFLLGLPTFIEGGQQLDWTRLRQIIFGAYVQDDWKVSRRLTLNLGLRYDIFSQPVDARDRGGFFNVKTGKFVLPGEGGFSRAILEGDHNNFAPRFGFAYQITDTLVARGGYGIFFGDQERNPSSNVLAANPPNVPVFTIPTVTKETTVAPPFTVATPIPAQPFDISLSAFSPTRPISRTFFAPDFETFVAPDVQQYNLSIQYERWSNWLFEISYAGSKGTHLGSRVNLNQLPFSAALSGRNLQADRPYPFINGLVAYDSAFGTSNYNSINFKVERRFTQGLALLANYSIQKTLEYGIPGIIGVFNQNGGTAIPLDSYNLEREVTYSPLDVPQRLVISGVYELPFGAGKRWVTSGPLAKLLGGWQVNGIGTARSGYPTDIRFAGVPPIFASHNVPDLVPGAPLVLSDWRRTLQYFNPAAFSAPPVITTADGRRVQTYGSAAKRIGRGPGATNIDFSLIKNTLIGERFNIQFRAEAFNLFNAPQFGLPGATDPTLTFGSSTFGQLKTSSNVGRQIQFGLKVLF